MIKYILEFIKRFLGFGNESAVGSISVEKEIQPPKESDTVKKEICKKEEKYEMRIVDDLLTRGSTNRRGDAMRELRGIVLHWNGSLNATPKGVRDFIANRTDFGSYNYILGMDGLIMRMIPENEVSWHAGTTQPDPVSGLVYTPRARQIIGDAVANNRTANWHTIGIGMCHPTWVNFTDATLEAAAQLCADICRRNNMQANRISNHWEMVGWKNCPQPWRNQPKEFEAFKNRVQALI
jgi:N-acetylmuramoyl-L-alanine amidase